MRRRLALLVAATTSIVLLAFTLPLAVLIDRAATNSAITVATDRSQRIVPTVAAGTSEEIRSAVASVADRDYWVVVRLPSGEMVGRRYGTDRPPVDAQLRATVIHVLSDGRVILDQPVVRVDGTAVISTLMSERVLDAGVWRAWAVLALLALLLFVLSMVVADRLARSMTRPVAELARTAELLGQGNLSARVVPSGPDEVREVGAALNRLAARIDELLTREREAVADLSHQLRTPITALRLDADSLRVAEERDRLSAHVDQLSRRVDALIREARRPVREGVDARCDARAVVRDRVAFWEVLADEQARSLRISLPEGECAVRAAPSDLAAAVDALLENVFAHTPEGAAFTVELTATQTGAELVVHDEGQGFPGEEVVHRGRSGAGSTGLGLDIARRTAVASGGGMEVGRSPAGGALVRLRLGAPAC